MAHRFASLSLVLALMGCPPQPQSGEVSSAASGEERPVEAPGVKAGDEGVALDEREEKPLVFDPGNPPPQYRLCRDRQCHTMDGRVLTYKEVMAEMGVTRMVGGLDTSKLSPPPANVASPPKEVERSESGLAWRVLTPGQEGESPRLSSRVLVHFEGWTSDGAAFDSSFARGRPLAFPLKRVIPGWQEALMMMTPGEKRRLWVPEGLAYKGLKGGPAGALTFDIELVKILTP